MQKLEFNIVVSQELFNVTVVCVALKHNSSLFLTVFHHAVTLSGGHAQVSVSGYATACVSVYDSSRRGFIIMAQRLSEAAANIHPEQIATELFTKAKTFFLDLKAKIA